MTSLIGYHVHQGLTYGRPYSADEKRRFWEHLDRLQPRSLLFLDDFDAAKEAHRRLPDTLIVFRQYRPNEGKLFRDMTPQAFYDSHAQFGDAGLIVSVMNEPTGYGEQNSPEDLEKIAAFMVKVMELHGKAGHRIVGPEFGVGHPDLKRLSELDAMWAGFKAWPQHFYGSHEYGTYRGMQYTDISGLRDVYPHRVGRYKAVIAYVRAKCQYELPIIINEWGIDSSFYPGDDHKKRGWRDAALSEVQYATELIKAAKEVYVEPNVKGVNIFSHGNSGKKGAADDWSTHDVAFLTDFQRELETYSAEQRPPAPFPYPPLPFGSDPRFKVRVNQSGSDYRVRSYPNIQYAESGWIYSDEAFNHIPDVEYENWIQVKNRTGIIGWADKGVMEKKLPPEPPPDPDEEEPPTTPSEPTDMEKWLLEAQRALTDLGQLHLELSITYKRLAIAEATLAELLKSRQNAIREARLDNAA